MATAERRWAGPAAAVFAFCLTLVLVAPPTSPPLSTAIPASIVADGLAVLAGHGFLGLVAIVGVYLGFRGMLHRPTLRAQRVTTPSRQINAA